MLILLALTVIGSTAAFLAIAICIFQRARRIKPSLIAVLAPGVLSILIWWIVPSTYIFGTRALEPAFWNQQPIARDLLSVLGSSLFVCILITLPIVIHFRNRT